MSLPELIYRFDGFAGFIVDALICALAANLYLNTRKRCMLLISIGSGVGALLILLPELLRDGGSSQGVWYFEVVLRIACSVVWLTGFWLLFQDYSDLIRGNAQPSAPPNGNPATPSGNSGATEGPPSVS